ncbi:hypothetical protein BD769DRAFT_1391609 [Suillus cothurnatus]|nr:hypothetical protein BD769DRAFT_1391609 [Suillus cothurnatus]
MLLTRPNNLIGRLVIETRNASEPELTIMNPNEQLQEKRRRGSPKGLKNGPNAGTTGRPVGRPRKDGSVRVPNVTAPSRSTTAGAESHNSDTSPQPGVTWSPTPSAGVDLHPTDVNNASVASTVNNSGNLQNSGTDHSDWGASCKHLNPLCQYDEQILCDYNEDEDDDIFDGIDEEVEYMHNEFAPLVNNDDDVLQGAAVPMPAENSKSEVVKTGRLACYENGQFTMTTPPLVFSHVVPYEIKPIDFYQPHFFVWLPHLLQCIPCPECKDAKWHTKQGQPVMLQVLGWPKQP